MTSKIDSKNSNLEHQFNKTNHIHGNSQHSDNRFGKKSRSMFFIRHTAHPKNLRFITGLYYKILILKDDK